MKFELAVTGIRRECIAGTTTEIWTETTLAKSKCDLKLDKPQENEPPTRTHDVSLAVAGAKCHRTAKTWKAPLSRRPMVGVAGGHVQVHRLLFFHLGKLTISAP